MSALDAAKGKLRPDFSRSASPASKPRRKQPSRRITLRLTAEEDARLRQLCEGVTVSAYIRQNLFGGPPARRSRRSHSPVQDQEALA